MICKECEKAGVESYTYIGPSYTTCMGGQQYYDGKGNFHNHDPNIHTTSYYCSNGHSWEYKEKVECPSCKEK
jgi:hypothetical protein